MHILTSGELVKSIKKLLSQFLHQNMKLRNSKIIGSDSKSDDDVDIHDKINADKQNDAINNGLEIELKSDASDIVSKHSYRSSNDIEIDLLKDYLNENTFINSSEANNQLEKETSIEIDIRAVGGSMYRSRENMVKGLDKERLATTRRYTKVKPFHLEHLKKYLDENSSMESGEARDRLHKDTGLKLHTITVNKYLNLLKEMIGSEWDGLDTIRSNSMESYKKLICAYELSNTHIEYLKKLLEEDSFIEPVQARNRIQEETGLDLNISSIYRCLKRLKKEMGLEYTKRRKLSSIFDIRKRHERSANIKCYHLEHLYNYLKEDISIDPAEAKKKLQKDTGLDSNTSSIRNTLTKLKKELDQQSSNHRDHTTLINYEYILNNTHVEHLKNYLNEDNSIDHIKARNKLQEDTGLNARIQTVKACLLKLRNEMGMKLTNLKMHNAKDKEKEKAYGYKINDAQIELLKMYLKEDRFILPTVAKSRIQKETGFQISIYSFNKAMTVLRKEIYPDSAKMKVSYSTKIPRGYRVKIKDVHVEHLKKYLKENILIGCADATYKLQEETGLRVSVHTVRRTLEKMREEMYPKHATTASPILHSKVKKSRSSSNSNFLNDVDVESLKRYLKEDNSKNSVETIVKLENDACLNLSYSNVKDNFNILNTEVAPSYYNMSTRVANSITKVTKSSNVCKLEDSHIEYLKRYLSEDSSIELVEARDRLHNDTGLVVRTQTIKECLSILKKDISLENVNQGSYTANGRRSNKGKILNGTRLEFLEVYFNEDSSITPTKAKNKLQEETGLEVDIVDIKKTLNMLRKEI